VDLPDLNVATLTGPASVRAGQVFKIATTILNSGRGWAAPARVRIYLSPSPGLQGAVELKTKMTKPLEPGGSGSFSTKLAIPVGIRPGTHYLIWQTNVDGGVPEVTGANNSATLPITLTPR
jgi:hypothetical protein